MDVTRILPALQSSIPQSVTQTAKADSVESFSDFLSKALSQTVETDYTDKATGIGIMTGSALDIHTATIAAQKAEIALNLTVQVRNKIVEAYQEVMRMQI